MNNMLLYYTQSHIKGISTKKEADNWKNGIKSLFELRESFGIQLGLFEDDPINSSITALESGSLDIFRNGLERPEYYRIAYSFPKKVMFLDIETTGLSKVYSYITLIGWMKDGEYKHVLHGNSISDFISDLNDSEVIVTFNGSIFDLPFIKSVYKDVDSIFIKKAHIDLRFFMRKYGYTGGQKEIEGMLNFKRPKTLCNTDGREAISLWYRFLKGDDNSLRTLLYYNCYDILGMIYLLNYVFFNHIYGTNIPKLGRPKRFIRKFKLNFLEANKIECEIAKNYVQKNITFFKHSFLKKSYADIIVGIDLTGSEEKASGCATIKGNNVITSLIYSDNDLLEYILKAKADLVSIDSPLSLPHGRNTVFDNDPARYEIGIMRHCERMLKKRGVNVYPALIQSMQRLTQRGISLAKRIRQLGIPVIESFPGAAQDVLQIPRKKTDLHFLKQGLIDFGVTGEFIEKKISHDELDAITSAFVGQFYISGYYEALGNTDEGYLIIPSTSKEIKDHINVYGICGPISTGKTEVARYIESKGYEYIRYSMVIAEYLEQSDIEVNRESLQKYGLKIYSEYGQYWLNKRLIESLETCSHIVIDGLRHPEDVAYLRESFYNTFNSVFIESDIEIRKKRYENNNNESYEKVLAHDVESNVGKLKVLCKNLILNNGTKDDLHEKIDTLLE